ncbi:MAG: PQQ-binding-like beta-propeller repeat protein [Planctomycetes bacterium]|nr:PQQ-binding-like beta-propeller repeat protein [Planctomycetota bacterium]
MLDSHVLNQTLRVLLTTCVILAGGSAASEALAAKPAKSEFEAFFGPQTDWPRYRGPQGNGVAEQKGLPVKWSKKENILWSVDLFQQPKDIYPLYPYTSPIVYKDKIFVTLATYKPGIFVEPPKNFKLKDPKPATFAELAEFKLVCFNKSDGRKLWETFIEPGEGWEAGPLPGDHGDECSFDVTTPCTDGERVYVAFGGRGMEKNLGEGVLAAVDYSGKVVWRQDFTKMIKGTFEYNLSTSPVLYKNTIVMVLTVGNGGGYTVAFDSKTGTLKYCDPRPVPPWPGRKHMGGHSTPTPVLANGTPLLLYNAIASVEGINPEDGKVVWFAKSGGGSSSMVHGGGIVYGDYASTKWSGAALALDTLAAAKGDITSAVKWRPPTDVSIANDDLGELSSPVLYGGYVYRAVGGKVYCTEAATGKVLYAEKLPSISWIANPIATGDGLIYFASSYMTYVLKAGPTFELVATNELDDGEFAPAFLHSWRPNGPRHGYPYSSFAVSEGKFFVLGSNKLWCVGK